MYSITLIDGRVHELFLTANAPADSVAISDADGETLRHSTCFSFYTFAEGVLSFSPPPWHLRNEAKLLRDKQVSALTVTTAAGNTFDGDEVSQGRMARAIIALQATGTPTVTWVLADNSVIQATVAELTEALALAGAAQAAIWVIA